MLSNLRNFSKTKLSGVLIAIIIVPFVFWGMGSVFSGGKTNNLAKINNQNISTDDFFKYLNKLNINPNNLKDKLNENTMSQILSEIISLKILDMETDKLGMIISDKNLSALIKKDKKFFNEMNVFSRVKYEKFLLENNISATKYEQKLKESKLQNDLFNYVSGGIKSPKFLVNNYFLEDTKVVNIEYIDLENIYKKDFTLIELQDFINKNIDIFEREYIDFSYTKIIPSTFEGIDEYDSDFFKILDKIENDILNGSRIDEIAQNYNFKTIKLKDFYFDDGDNTILKDIYENRQNNSTNLIDKEDYFLLYEIKNSKKKIPDLSNKIFYKEVNERIKKEKKFEYNKNLLKIIETNKFNDKKFLEIAVNKNNIKKLKIKSKNDNSFLNIDSLKMLYTIPENNFLLIVDNDKKVYLTKIISFEYNNIDKADENYNKYNLKSNFKIKNNITSTYDEIINKNYSVEVNQNTLDRVMNYLK